jgi:hypothetical protein
MSFPATRAESVTQTTHTSSDRPRKFIESFTQRRPRDLDRIDQIRLAALAG